VARKPKFESKLSTMEKAILESVGGEIVSIVTPVSICMLLVVLLVHTLTPHGSVVAPIATVAMMVYSEKPNDSLFEKLRGGFLNAIIFVCIVMIVTFVLFGLFYFRFTKCLRVYMGFSAFMVLAWMGGTVMVELIQFFSIPIDVITFGICLVNFASVGVIAVFFSRMPIVLTQGYLVVIGMLVAFWFTKLPEWTTWTLLISMAVYDIMAVLAPVGPLNMLLELAMTRDEEIPALIYEARPVLPRQMPGPPPTSSSSTTVQPRRWSHLGASPHSLLNIVIGRGNSAGLNVDSDNFQTSNLGTVGGHELTNFVTEPPIAPEAGLLGSRLVSSTGDAGTLNSVSSVLAGHQPIDPNVDEDTVPLVNHGTRNMAAVDRMELGTQMQPRDLDEDELERNDEGFGLAVSGALKLGLGDFVFYSVLVGRAAMYDLMTVYACYLAIVGGLGTTLILLAVWRRAMPALPISISLGVVFYFLTRLIMDPFVVDLATHLVFF
jgi:presenilin 1